MQNDFKGKYVLQQQLRNDFKREKSVYGSCKVNLKL
jgi:hypothetical protein